MFPGTAVASLSSGEAARRLGDSEQRLAQRVDLTVGQLRSYMHGAQAVGGLDAQAVLTTLRHPELMRGVPVSMRVGWRTVRAAIPKRGCRFTESFSEFKSPAGIPLWRFSVTKYWCWNRDKRRVDANPKVFVAVKVPQAAAVSGWKYDGLDKGGKYDNLFRWNNASGGAHLTIRRGVFKWCPPRVACFNTRRPTIAITGYYDGHVTDRRTIG
jgi:hypothetical protein